MVHEASFIGVVKTILILIGVLVALRFIGRLMIAKRNLDEEREMLSRQRAFEKEKNEKLRNFGKVNIGKQSRGATEDADFTEVRD